MTISSATATPSSFRNLAGQFLVDKEVAFLNHGSFGACPAPVFEVYQGWQRQLESQPVDFIQRRVPDLLAAARETLAEFVGTSADNLVFVPNATYGINVVARSLDLQPGDEVLTTDHEYGAVNATWQFNCEKRRARLVTQPIPLPVTDEDDFVETLWQGVTEKTRAISISHVTAPTALIFPLHEICRRARQAGITTIIDGAHAPGQVDLALDELGATYYTGNAHKWLCAPKGSAFLYSTEGRDSVLEPLVVSHGWLNGKTGSAFQDNFTWTGTMDPSAYLSVPAAIQFQRENDWPAVQAACHDLARHARARIHELTGLEPICPDSRHWYAQMFTARLPEGIREDSREWLWTERGIEVPVGIGERGPMIRVSIQAYNTPDHIDRLLSALQELCQHISAEIDE